MADGWDVLRDRLLQWARENRVWNDRQDKPKNNELADAVGLSPSYLSQFLSGSKPGTWEIGTKCARLIGVDLAEVVPPELASELPAVTHGNSQRKTEQASAAVSSAEVRGRQARQRLRDLAYDILGAVERTEADLRREIQASSRDQTNRRKRS